VWHKSEINENYKEILLIKKKLIRTPVVYVLNLELVLIRNMVSPFNVFKSEIRRPRTEKNAIIPGDVQKAHI
jgi:hypothetical protein